MDKLISVGLDVGTTTTQLVLSELTVENRGNATEEVKAAADTVTADCDHDGVAQVIETYLLH